MTSAIAPTDSGVYLSVVIPILNERDSLRLLHQQITEVLQPLDDPYEIIFVDDGSSDGSVAVCRDLVDRDHHVVLIELRRNFGKALALSAGFQVARGELIVTMDGDLQDDASEMPRLLAALDEGADLVSGWKRERHDPMSKTLPSRFFNAVTSRMTGLRLHDFNCGFKAYRRDVVAEMDLYGELHRYIPVLAHAKGFKVTEVPVRHHERRFGTSKYSLERFTRGAFDLLTVLFLSVFRRRPLHLFGLIGSVLAMVGFAINGYLTILWFTGTRPIGDRPLLILGTLLIILGVQVLLFGLLAEMINAATYRRDGVQDAIRTVRRREAGRPAGRDPLVLRFRPELDSTEHEPQAADSTDEHKSQEVQQAAGDRSTRGNTYEGQQQSPDPLAHPHA